MAEQNQEPESETPDDGEQGDDARVEGDGEQTSRTDGDEGEA